MKRSVGIITILKVNNYGAELQAFALQYKLRKLGYNAEIIDYLFYKHKDYIREKASEPFYPFPLKKRIKEFVLPKLELLKSLMNKTAFESRERSFEEFHKRNTKFSEKTYCRYSELYDTPPCYDVYCVGSDQVWNPSCFTSLYPYFLTFAPHGKRKISYASSFGVSKIPSSAKNEYRDCLNNLDVISVRERTGAKLVKELSGKSAKVVLDPTLLLTSEEWITVADTKKVQDKKYILLYVLKDCPRITEIALKLSREKGLDIVRICKNAFRQDSTKTGIHDILDASPADYVGLFENATIVLTNSFHGTAFSIIFKRDFYTITYKGKENNSRMTDLLECLGIDRLKYVEDKFELSPDVDWISVARKLDVMRQDSIKYLTDAIG